MKRGFWPLLACLTLATAVWAAGYSVNSELQTGNGTNGMTYTPLADGGSGAPVVTGPFGGVIANYARITTCASGSNTWQNAGDISWLDAQRFSPSATNQANYVWNRSPAQDLEVDGGRSGKPTPLGSNCLQYVVGPLPYSQNATSGERWDWTCENCQQSTTLDAGVQVMVELLGGNPSL